MIAPIAHAIDSSDHTREWWGYVTFFVLAAAMQLFYGIILLLQPWRYDETGGARSDAYGFGRPYYITGIALNASVIILYIVTRTISVPHAAEPVTALSLVPIAVNVPSTYCLVMLVRRTRGHP